MQVIAKVKKNMINEHCNNAKSNTSMNHDVIKTFQTRIRILRSGDDRRRARYFVKTLRAPIRVNSCPVDGENEPYSQSALGSRIQRTPTAPPMAPPVSQDAG